MIRYICLPFYELNPDQFYAVMVLRQEVFVVEQDCPYLDADGKDQESWHLLGMDNQNDLVAYVRILPKGLSYQEYASIGRVVTSQKIRGSGVGRQLMEKAIKRTQDLFPKTPIKISAQTYLLKFYQSLGFKEVGEEYLEDDIPHIGMVLKSY